MNPASDHEVIALSLTIPASLVALLRAQCHRDFVPEQPGRFLPLGDGRLPSPDAPEFETGTLTWPDCVAGALLLRACEEAAGEVVTLLSDECDEFFNGVVVLSSRPFDSPW